MKITAKYLLYVFLLFPTPLLAWKWIDLWQTPDQQGITLLKSGKAKDAAKIFKNKDWQAVAHYRDGNYPQAYQQFHQKKTSDAWYNSGNAAAFMGQYQEAIDAYDKAIAVNSNNHDAIFNREIIKKLMNKKQQTQKNANNSSSKPQSAQDKSKQEKSNQDQTQQQANKDQANKEQAHDKQNQQQNNPQSSQQNTQQTTKNKTANESTQANNASQQNDDRTKQKEKPVPTSTSLNPNQQNQDERKKQFLRRIADDPGGLLKQKFLRDYLRRHAMQESSD